jgi:hypothetical protein
MKQRSVGLQRMRPPLQFVGECPQLLGRVGLGGKVMRERTPASGAGEQLTVTSDPSWFSDLTDPVGEATAVSMQL